MLYCKANDTYIVRIDAGQEVLACLKELCRKENVSCAHVSAIGAASHAIIGVYDLEKQEYCREELNGFMEIASLTGNVTQMNGQVYLHLHGVLADQNHRLYGGHIIELQIGATCELYLRVLPASISREKDDSLGINLIRPGL